VRGRKPVPAEQRLLEGNPGKRPIPEPVLVGGRPGDGEMTDPPDHLPAEAKAFWRVSVARLIDVGIVDRVDGPLLEMLATTYARWRQASRVLAVDGHFVHGIGGSLRAHPAIKIERDANAAFLRMAEHFALSPVARTRLGLQELHRRTLAAELADALGEPDLQPIDVDAQETTDAEAAVGLP
jgi:P27 family predicted phage terminase small subunit